MFGIWRLVLAFEVVVFHLLSIPIIGAYAVISFFVLSGFLMTTIMHETYGYTLRGMGSYALNRGLRLYPNFWFAGLVTLLVIAAFGQTLVSAYHPAMTVPASAFEWLQNLSLVYAHPVPIGVRPILSPPTWALTVELAFYIAIGIGISRSRKFTLAWLAFSIVYVAAAFYIDRGRFLVYGSIPGGSLPFAIGATTYHFRDRIWSLLARFRFALAVLVATRWLMIAGMIVFIEPVVADWRVGEFLNIVNAALSAAIVVVLFNLKGSPRARKVDSFLGDYSYPVYLLHFQIGALASALLFGAAIRDGSGQALAVFGLAVALMIPICSVSVFLIDPAVRQLRDKVRRLAG